MKGHGLLEYISVYPSQALAYELVIASAGASSD